MSTYSDLKIEIITTGDQSGAWGDTTNNNLQYALSEAITGSADVNFASAADVTLTLTNTNTSQTARNLRLNLTESSTGVGYVGNVILGSGCQIKKLYLVNNTTTAAKTIKNTTGTGITVPAGKSMFVFNNGTNVVDAVNAAASMQIDSLTATTANVGTLTATADSAFTSTGALQIPVGTTAQQPTGVVGKIRYNTTVGLFEGYSTGAWGPLSGSNSSPSNLIMNGSMQINQRVNIVTNTPTTSGYNTVDRWKCLISQSSKLSFTQISDLNAPLLSTTIGFRRALSISTVSAYSPTATDYFVLQQKIAPSNYGQLKWGTASAQPVTLSFQVYSSLTGTFGGSINNSVNNRSYPFTYSVPTANTWTSISITITGDTSGTWTSGYLQLNFGLGVGTTYSGTAGSWAAGTYYSATGAVSPVSTLSAVFDITGVQLQVGSYNTGFIYVPYQQELADCLPYCQIYSGSTGTYLTTGQATSTTTAIAYMLPQAPFATTATLSYFAISTINASGGTTSGATVSYTYNNSNSINLGIVSSGLVAGNAVTLSTGSSGYLYFNADY